jgi:hypothetical protein
MATSGSINYNQTRNEIITDALSLLGVVSAGGTAKANDITFCSNQLNKMVKAWQAQGVHLWKETEGTITIVTDQYQYTLNSTNFPSIGRPVNIINCRYKYSSGLERKMTKMGRSEYMAIPTKTTSEGPCTAFYYSPQLSSGELYVWPVPQDTSDSLVISYIKTFEDFDSSTDDPDFPQEWLECLTLNLAVRVSPAYGKDLAKSHPTLLQEAKLSLQELKGWDSEEGSVRIIPNRRDD